MAVALPYLFYTAVAASTYVSVTSAQKAAHSASTVGDLNARAISLHGEENAQAAEAQGESQAQISQRQATASLQQAQTEALAIRRQNDRVRGTQRVSFLKSGVTLSGSAQDVMYDSAIEGELEALSAEYKGKVAYSQNQDEAAYARSQGSTSARLYRSRAGTDSILSAYEGSSRASAYRAQSVGSFFSGVATAAGGPSFT
jgi:hypothetical protein